MYALIIFLYFHNMCYYNGMRVTRAQYIRLLNLEKEQKAMSRPVQSGFDYRDWPIIKPTYGSTDFEIKNVIGNIYLKQLTMCNNYRQQGKYSPG
ncbi:MAG: hypothetical protein WDO19_02645 [Bacteroidota bacterium]